MVARGPEKAQWMLPSSPARPSTLGGDRTSRPIESLSSDAWGKGQSTRDLATPKEKLAEELYFG